MKRIFIICYASVLIMLGVGCNGGAPSGTTDTLWTGTRDTVHTSHTDSIFVRDSVFTSTRDSIFITTIDTVFTSHVDSFVITTIDTVHTSRIDSIFSTVYYTSSDTIYTATIDSIYVVDSVFTTIYTSHIDTIRTEHTKLSHMQRSNLKMMYLDLLGKRLAPTRWITNEDRVVMLDRAVELFEAGGWLEFGASFQDSIYWIENDSLTYHIERFYWPRLLGWFEWEGVGHDTLRTSDFNWFLIQWDSVPQGDE